MSIFPKAMQMPSFFYTEAKNCLRKVDILYHSHIVTCYSVTIKMRHKINII